jgi:RND superfamily putative drug exporter
MSMFRTKHSNRRSDGSTAAAGAPTASSGHPRNLAARMGRWSASHWKTATFGWLAFVLVAFAVGSAVGTKTIDPLKPGPGESGRVDRILDAGFAQPAGESVLIQSGSLKASDPAFRAAIEDVVAGLNSLGAVQNVRSPLDPAHAGQIAENGRAALVEFEIRGDADKAADKIGPVLGRVAELQAAHPQLYIGEFGEASAVDALATAFEDDLGKAGMLSLPITLIILVIAFGALVAAGIPLLVGLTAVFATLGLIALPSQFMPVGNETFALVLLVGLAVGVDYAMFYLKREREERAAGRSNRAALEAAAATSGRSVLISGLTVMVAMAGMFMTGDAHFASFGLATMLVVAIAVLGSLTVLPALLSRLGDKVDRGRVPFVGRIRRDDGEGRVWGAIADRVLRRPVLSAVLAGGLLVALALPALQLRTVSPGPDTFPKSIPAVQAYDRMQQAFPGTALPANVVVKAPNVNAPAVREAIDRLEQRAIASGRAYEPITVDVNRNGTVANITVPIAGTGTDRESMAALATLREIVPETVGAVANAETGVTGLTAQWKDNADTMASAMPLVVAFVLVFAFGLMLFAFRSIVVAAKAIVLNLLSVAAAYGVLVLVFQHGVGSGLLGFSSTAGIDPVVPLLLFVILFGLSMDYHVLVLGRIRELYERGEKMDDAISHGIKHTAGVVTSAAVVMVFVFGIFATLSMLFFKQFGVGLATAVLIDATIVRAVLLPASMKLLGEWNWYLPRWLQWIPRLEPHGLEPVPEPEPAAVSAVAAGDAKNGGRAERKRALTFARILGLVLIALVAVALGYLRLSGDGAVSVPSGAKPGELTLHSCHYATESGSYAADCGTLVVPENRADRDSRLIALPVTRIKALSADSAEPVFRLEGGPGITNMTFPKASRLADDHDVVLVGYRGVDSSVRLDCPEVESALARSEDIVGQKSLRASAAGFRSCAERLQGDGVDLAGYTLAQRVDDLEAARRALGYERIDLVSESAGTRTAMIYSWRYPERIHRSVMIGANPPGHFIWDGKTTDEQLRRYAVLCASDDTCSRRTDDLAASMRRTAADMPDHWAFLPIKPGNVRLASFFGLMESTQENAPLSSPMTLGSWLSADQGDASGLWLQSLMADMFFPKSFVWGEFAATGLEDAAFMDAHYAAGGDRGSILGNAGTDLITAGGELTRAWPTDPGVRRYDRVRTSNVETLLVGGELDLATPPQVATKELLPHLPNGRQVVLPGFAHSLDFWTYQPEASTRLLTTFLDTGKVDRSLYEPQKVDFTPEVTQTALAKGIGGAMTGLAALVALSILWMPIGSRRHGGYGRLKRAFLRSAYAVVLGLGGWFLGVLIAVTTMPGVPIDDELLAAVSIGVPAGLAVYWGWVRRDSPATARWAGLAAAIAGALGGAWLGFHATADLLALVTAIVGSVAAANLALIVLDVARARAANAGAAAADVPRPVVEPASPVGVASH